MADNFGAGAIAAADNEVVATAPAARTTPRTARRLVTLVSDRLHALSQRKDVPRQAKRQRFLVEPIEEHIFSNLVRYALDRWKVFLQRRRFRQEAIERRGRQTRHLLGEYVAVTGRLGKASRFLQRPFAPPRRRPPRANDPKPSKFQGRVYRPGSSPNWRALLQCSAQSLNTIDFVGAKDVPDPAIGEQLNFRVGVSLVDGPWRLDPPTLGLRGIVRLGKLGSALIEFLALLGEREDRSVGMRGCFRQSLGICPTVALGIGDILVLIL